MKNRKEIMEEKTTVGQKNKDINYLNIKGQIILIKYTQSNKNENCPLKHKYYGSMAYNFL